MTLNEEASLIRNCVFSKRTKYPLQITHSDRELQECLTDHNIDEVYFNNIESCFKIISEKELCEDHQKSTDECGCTVDKEETYIDYQLDAEGLLSWWGEWVDQSKLFKTDITFHRENENRYSAFARYNGVKVEFAIFLSADELERYNLSPEALEFGIAFIHPEYALEMDDTFLWYELLEEHFQNEFTSKLNEYQYCIPAPFANISTDAGYRRPIRRSFAEYLGRHGFDPRRSVGEDANIVHDFQIPVSEISLLATADDEVVILCDCERHSMWHWHRFDRGNIVNVEDNDIINHMLDKMDDNIDHYQRLKSYQTTIKGLSTALGGLAVIISLATLIANFQTASSYINSIIPIGTGAGTVAAAMLVFGTVLVVLSILTVVSPFLRERFLFDWSISDYNEQSRFAGLRDNNIL